MIVEYIRYALTKHAPDDLIGAYGEAARQLDASIHCIDYELSQCAEDPQCFILRIRWQSAEAHMQGFRRSASFPPFLDAVRPFVGEIVKMRHYRPTLVGGTGAGATSQ